MGVGKGVISMAMEKKWAPVSTVLTAQGGTLGQAQVASTLGFYVGQIVAFPSGASDDQYKIKRIFGPNQMILGPVDQKIDFTSDLSAYDSGIQLIAALQERSVIPLSQIERYLYAEEPIMALRTVLVDAYGNSVSSSSGGSIPTAQVGKTVVDFNRLVYASSGDGLVTTTAWTQLIASMPAAVTEMEIFDSSGQTLQLGFGEAGQEVAQMLVLPGGNGRVPLSIPAGTRVSIQALSANATSGESDINFYG
jgi:hypothetical protein